MLPPKSSFYDLGGDFYFFWGGEERRGADWDYYLLLPTQTLPQQKIYLVTKVLGLHGFLKDTLLSFAINIPPLYFLQLSWGHSPGADVWSNCKTSSKRLFEGLAEADVSPMSCQDLLATLLSSNAAICLFTWLLKKVKI